MTTQQRVPAKRRSTIRRAALLSTVSFAALISVPVLAADNTSCINQGAATNCATPVNATNNTDIINDHLGEPSSILVVSSRGTDGLGSAKTPGASSSSVMFTNNNLLKGTVALDGFVITGLTVNSVGGAGAVINGQAGSGGGNGGPVTADLVAGSVRLNGSFAVGGRAVDVFSSGGSGGGGNGHSGGRGGDGGAAVLSNRSLIALGEALDRATGNPASSNGGQQVAGASVRSTGGAGGNGVDNHGAAGGNGGTATVTSSGQISVYWSGEVGARGLFGLQAVSRGGAADAADKDADYKAEDYGGRGGNAGAVSVTLNTGGDIHLDGINLGSAAAGAGVKAESTGGAGGAGPSHGYGGNGGSGGSVTVQSSGASVAASGDGLSGIVAVTTGGQGGAGVTDPDSAHGGDGAGAGLASIAVSSAAGGPTVTVSTIGAGANALVAAARGGDGGAGGSAHSAAGGLDTIGNSGLGGFGGTAQYAQVSVDGHVMISTSGDDSLGIVAISAGGNGGAGGSYSAGNAGTNCNDQGTDGRYAPHGHGGCGGNGADAGNAVATLSGAVTLETSGASATGIKATSLGGDGGNGGDLDAAISAGRAGDGGDGGDGAFATVTTGAGTSIITHGVEANGIVAQSVSGAGGSGGDATATFGATGGNAGVSGNTGTVSVSNGGSVLTEGDGARGILAQGQTGAGGSGGHGQGVFYSKGSSGGSAGTLGAVSVSNSGQVETAGDNATAVLAQSIGGSGGAAGSASIGVFSSLGGSDEDVAAASGGSVAIANGGAVTTAGEFSIGLAAQSIGGGGGDGGNANGVFGSVGGSGGGGGNGGRVTIGGASGGSFGTVSTSGDYGHGLLAQSIGGGGGTAGNANSTSALVAVALGGSGGAGGDGGAVTVAAQGGSIVASGSKAIGIIGQSIGGGGGTGGGGYSLAVGPLFSAAVAVGGSGGDGGDAAGVGIDLGGTAVTTGFGDFVFTNVSEPIPDDEAVTVSANVDAYGIVAQSIGGGGGNGGTAVANAVSIPIRLPTEEPTKLAVEIAVGVGGSGGSGGDANGVTSIDLHDGATVTTGGQGSHGVVAQSIGGGGGNGGDSSATATMVSNNILLGRLQKLSKDDPDSPYKKPDTLDLSISVAVGGSGGAAGDGGQVQFNLGDATLGPASSVVETFGDMADGVLLQSIGGGGGNGGFGSGTTKNYGGAKGLDVEVGVGGTGEAGGTGGGVTATIGSDGIIRTYGENAYGLVAQSIGGGGGTSQGVTVGAGLAGIPLPEREGTPFSDEAELEATVKVGQAGGAGGDGSTVSLVVKGLVATFGNGSAAILAQSIGGGGGVAGGFGTEASADNPIDSVLRVRKGIRRILDGFKLSVDGSVDVTVGAGASAPSHGGTVTLDLTGATIATDGDHAQGVLAQSIGGGGGVGASAATSCGDGFEAAASDLPEGVDGDDAVGCATGDEANPDEEAVGEGFAGPVAAGVEKVFVVASQPLLGVDVSVAGGGSKGGDGGAVQLTLGGTRIETGGYGSHGVQAQSIGGGGGIGGDGSDVSEAHLSVGAAVNGSGGSAGDGGLVTIQQGAGASWITTHGEGAHAIFAQSVGGSGGQALSANSDSDGALEFAEEGIGLSAVLAVGGGSGSSGHGGNVSVGEIGGQPLSITINTLGNNAYGILAQSVGGGGGLAASSASASNPEYSIGGGRGAGGHGGDVTAYTFDSSSITTAGLGAHGILAQSVGGGGGVAGYASSAASGVVTSLPSSSTSHVIGGNGGGGQVNVQSNGTITTTGVAAFGIFAQSVGGGGGIIGSGGTIFAGTAGTTTNASTGIGGKVIVAQSGSIKVTGANTIGIFAQSTDRLVNSGNAIDVGLYGRVQGGSGDNGYGVYIHDGSPDAEGNTLNLGSTTADLSALSGKAIGYAGNGSLLVTNDGTVTGSVFLNGVSDIGRFDNEGTFVTGASVVGTLDNNGLLNPGGTGTFQTTQVTGNFTQGANGKLAADVDFGEKHADLVSISGTAALAGTVEVNAITLLPNVELAILTATGGVTGALTVSDTSVIDFGLRLDGTHAYVSANAANFATPEVKLSSGGSAVARHLQASWDAGGASGLGTLFAAANAAAVSDPGAYANLLNGLAPGASHGAAARRVADLHGFGNTLMSCPAFEGNSAMLIERECGWTQISGRAADHGGTDGSAGYDSNSIAWQLGGQVALAPNWFVGGALAYEKSWLSDDAGAIDSDGDSGLGGVSLKYQDGPWLLSGALFGAYGTYDTTRVTGLPGLPAVASSSSDVEALGARLQASYTIGSESFYLRPSLKLDEIYVRSPGYSEDGAGALGLIYETSDHATTVITPTVEVGGRVDLSPDTVVRTFANVGIGFLTDDEYGVEARLAGAPTGSAPIRTSTPIDDQVLRIGTGVQLTSNGTVGLRLQYDGEFADQLTAHSGSVRMIVNF
jgi:uncharacterized protein YhjY with autotransporter beta-barrel domain